MSNPTVLVAAEGMPENPATHQSARAAVDRLMAELRNALAACGMGAIRATIDSDGHAVVQSLVGRPLVDGSRVVGVVSLMQRTIYGPERRPRDIVVEAAR